MRGKFAVSEYGFMLFSVTRDRLQVHVIDYSGNILYSTTLNKNK